MIHIFINEAGRLMAARLVQTGDRYGLDGRLTADQPMIEFYLQTDRPHNDWLVNLYGLDHNLFFISRYNLPTFLFGYGRSVGAMESGICLEGSQPQYNLSAENCREVVAHLFMESVK